MPELPALGALELAVEISSILAYFNLGSVTPGPWTAQYVFIGSLKSFSFTWTEDTCSAIGKLAIEVEPFGIDIQFGSISPRAWTLQKSVGGFQDVVGPRAQTPVELSAFEGPFYWITARPWYTFVWFLVT